MNILVACNEKYLNLARYMLFSLAAHNGKLNVYLIHENISDELLGQFIKFFENNDIGNLNVINFDSSQIVLPLKDDIITGHITKEAYFRLYAPFFLPNDMERILYLDCDIICTDNISDFYNIDFGDKILVGCANNDLANSEYKERLGLSDEHIYINSGVLLINLSKYRECTSISSLNKFIAENADLLDFQDQDVVNKMFTGNILYSDVYYNFQIGMLLYTEGGKLVHYTGPIKPWSEEYNRPILAKPFYNVLSLMGETELLFRLKGRHLQNFKERTKLASIVIDSDFLTEDMIKNVICQLESRVEFVLTYNEIDESLIKKYCEIDCRLEFVEKKFFDEYSKYLMGFYHMFLNIDDFENMDVNFIREICYFIDVEELAVVFYKDLEFFDNNKIVDFGKKITASDVVELIEKNSKLGYRYIYVSDYSETKTSRYGYWGE